MSKYKKSCLFHVQFRRKCKQRNSTTPPHSPPPLSPELQRLATRSAAEREPENPPFPPTGAQIQNPQLPTTPQLQRLIAQLAMVIEQDIPPPPQYPPPPPPTGVEPATGPLEEQFD